MCDTILASPDHTAQRIMMFGKNSDRQRNEAQTVEYFPRADYAPDAELACTYITIPQAKCTHTVLLCRPFWGWGAEMGANEFGVVIGNEGVHARSPAPEEKALTGMDLLRLTLERAGTASEAVEVMTTLLERHGQGGNGGHHIPAYYNNGFMIADASEGFVVETLGREWLVEKVRGVRAVSNRYSIGREVHRVSEGLPALIRDCGWSAEAEPNYAEVIANPHREHIGNAGSRHARSTSLLNSRCGQLGVADMMKVLRDHGSGDQYDPEWRKECAIKRTLCMHAGAEDRPGQTVGSMVSELHHKHAVHWVTGTAAPCISIFKPVLTDAPLPPHGPRPTDLFDPSTLWWRHEQLHRAAVRDDFAQFHNDFRAERDALEADFNARVKAVLNAGEVTERAQVIADCWRDAIEMENRWLARISKPAAQDETAYWTAWLKMSQICGIS